MTKFGIVWTWFLKFLNFLSISFNLQLVERSPILMDICTSLKLWVLPQCMLAEFQSIYFSKELKAQSFGCLFVAGRRLWSKKHNRVAHCGLWWLWTLLSVDPCPKILKLSLRSRQGCREPVRCVRAHILSLTKLKKNKHTYTKPFDILLIKKSVESMPSEAAYPILI